MGFFFRIIGKLLGILSNCHLLWKFAFSLPAEPSNGQKGKMCNPLSDYQLAEVNSWRNRLSFSENMRRSFT